MGKNIILKKILRLTSRKSLTKNTTQHGIVLSGGILGHTLPMRRAISFISTLDKLQFFCSKVVRMISQLYHGTLNSDLITFSDFAKLSRFAISDFRASFSDFAKLSRFAISVLRESFSPLAQLSKLAISCFLAPFSVSNLPSSFAMSVMRAWLSFCVLSSRDLISFFLRSFSLSAVTTK